MTHRLSKQRVDHLIKSLPKRNSSLHEVNKRLLNSWEEARRIDVSELRSVLGRISTVSLTTFGFAFAFLDKNLKLASSPQLYSFGIILLGLTSIASLWYLLISTENSILNGLENYKENRRENREFINNDNDYLIGEISEIQYAQEYERLRLKLEEKGGIEKLELERNYWLITLISLFSVSFLSIMLSLFIETIWIALKAVINLV